MKLYTVTGPLALFLLTSCGGSGDSPPGPSQECHQMGGETVCTDTQASPVEGKTARA